MAQTGNYVAAPRSPTAAISTANTARDGSGTLATVATGPARNLASDPPAQGGMRIDALAICAGGTTTAGMVRLFVHDGTNARLIAEIPVDAATPSATVQAWAVRLNKDVCDFMPLVLAAGASLRASTHNAETFYATVLNGGDF